nr:phospholipase-like, aminotransferase-like mobile domain protein [Tanacetum cinerariifolium]
MVCCNRCNCVPPGHSGNHDVCGTCYTDLKTLADNVEVMQRMLSHFSISYSLPLWLNVYLSCLSRADSSPAAEGEVQPRKGNSPVAKGRESGRRREGVRLRKGRSPAAKSCGREGVQLQKERSLTAKGRESSLFRTIHELADALDSGYLKKQLPWLFRGRFGKRSIGEYSTRIHVSSKLYYFLLIKGRLNEECCTLFHTTCFGPWLDITYVDNDDGMVHYILQKQCCSDDDSFDLPLIYSVNGHSLYFGRCEFGFISGFKFGSLSFHEYRNGDILFHIQLVPKKIWYDVKIIDVLALIEDEEKFSKVSDEDAMRHCLLLSLEIDSEEFHLVLRGREKGRDDASIDRVRDLEGICESLLTLPKEIKSLRGHIFKLESIIQVITLKRDSIQKDEKLKKFVQKEDLLQDTSEDESDNKDDTSPEK